MTATLHRPRFVPAANLLWRTLPERARRVSVLLAAIIGDGAYLRAWPPIAAIVPPALLVIGLLIGADHDHETYTYSLALLTLLAVIAGFGAALGFWTWLGYVLGDLLLFDRSPYPTVFAGSTDRVYIPILISYALLGALLMFTPIIATGFRFRATRAMPRSSGWVTGGAFAFQAVIQSMLTYSWAQSTAFLIRPFWSYQDSFPDIAAITPLQQHSGRLALATGAAVVARGALTVWSLRAGPRTDGAKRERAVQTRPARRPVPVWIRVPLTAIGMTVLASGLLSGFRQGILVATLLAVILMVRAVVVPRIPVWSTMIRRVPLLVRAAFATWFAYLLAKHFVVPEADRGTVAFTPVVTSIVWSAGITAFLLPPEHRGERRRPKP